MESIIQSLPKKFIHDDKYGLISLSAIISETPKALIEGLLKYLGLNGEEGLHLKPREEILEKIIYTYSNPLKMPGILAPLNSIGEKIINFPKLQNLIRKFDFISKKELIDIFADFCADLQINVFEASSEKYGLDLYLTKKIKRLRTESVFVLTGSEIEEEYNDNLFERIEASGTICDWKVFVTSALGAAKIGYERLVNEMKNLNVWIYIIDPFHKRVMGATKGSKSRDQDKNARDEYIRTLPSEPIRAISQVVKRSKYKWEEKEAYDDEKIVPYYLLSRDGEKFQFEQNKQKYADKFKTFLVISKKSGVLMYSFTKEKDSFDNTLISGFLTAINSFVDQLAKDSGLNEIDYKNLKVLGSTGTNIQVVAMMNQSPGKGFVQRLDFICKHLEKNYGEQIEKFVKMGNQSIINELKWDPTVQDILSI